MPTAYKVLGQVAPAAATDTTLYTVPAATSVVASTISVCNTDGAPALFRVAVRPAGAAINIKHYLAYDSVVTANDSVMLTLGITLAATDVVTVRSTTALLAFTIFGGEIT